MVDAMVLKLPLAFEQAGRCPQRSFRNPWTRMPQQVECREAARSQRQEVADGSHDTNGRRKQQSLYSSPWTGFSKWQQRVGCERLQHATAMP